MTRHPARTPARGLVVRPSRRASGAERATVKAFVKMQRPGRIQWIERKDILDERTEAIVTARQIDGIRGKVDLRSGRDT